MQTLGKRDPLGRAEEEITTTLQIQIPRPHHGEAIAATNEGQKGDRVRIRTTHTTNTIPRAGPERMLTRAAMVTSLRVTSPTDDAETRTMTETEETDPATTEIGETGLVIAAAMIDTTTCSGKGSPVESPVTMIAIAETAMMTTVMATAAGAMVE